MQCLIGTVSPGEYTHTHTLIRPSFEFPFERFMKMDTFDFRAGNERKIELTEMRARSWNGHSSVALKLKQQQQQQPNMLHRFP